MTIERKEQSSVEVLKLAQPSVSVEQEPVGEVIRLSVGGDVKWFSYVPEVGTMLYTAPPQRTWVGLTPDVIASLWVKAEREDSSWVDFSYKRFARALESELKKNNHYD